MTINRIAARISNAFGQARSASRVVAALQTNRQPDPQDLRRLGMDPRVFLSIGHG
ncbi:MAG: hypothetical protein QM699_18120 [Amaricoccus sp.]|uniref:hypothetical protein n=1 Tax=Amaricoccus sp. TaxID=1872485 RepID=UPI0039E3C846